MSALPRLSNCLRCCSRLLPRSLSRISLATFSSSSGTIQRLASSPRIPEGRLFLHTSARRTKTFEPDYLDAAKSLPPTYPLINIQLKGFDYHILESYQRYVHNLCENMGVSVKECWATPCTTLDIKTFHIGGTNVQNAYELNIYERNIQVENMQSTDAPILFDLLRRTLPEGVDVSVHQDTEAHYEARFIPDPFIEGLKKELKGMEEKKEELAEEREKRKVEKEAKKKEALLRSLDIDDD